MLRLMVIAVRPQPVALASHEIAGSRARWVRTYRQDVPGADRWARGLRRVPHSLETQERVFRMAEQLQRLGIAHSDLFLELEEADRSVAASPEPVAAARAGHRVMNSLLPLAKESIVICADHDQPDLRGFGFDPIEFDGNDPAAYAWVIYELSARSGENAERQTSQCTCHPAAALTAIGLARL